MSLMLRFLPLVNPAMIAGLFANNASGEEIVTQVAGISDTGMLLTIIGVALIQWAKNKFGKDEK